MIEFFAVVGISTCLLVVFALMIVLPMWIMRLRDDAARVPDLEESVRAWESLDEDRETEILRLKKEIDALKMGAPYR